MTVVAAITIGPPNCFRCAAGLCPRLFRRTGFNQKKTFVIPRAVVLLSYASDHSVPDINRIKHHIACVPVGEPHAIGKQSLLSHVPLLFHHVITVVESGDGEYIAIPLSLVCGTPRYIGQRSFRVPFVDDSPRTKCFLSECDSYFMPISIRLFWNFFLKPSNGFGLFVSTLHEAGSLLLFFLAPSCFLLSFLKGFTCHKNSLSVMDPLGHCLYALDDAS